jgi:hypothetical protein
LPESRNTIIRLSLLLYVLTLLAYAPALRGGFIWDDDDYVENNLNLRSSRGLVDIWTAARTSPQYYPMVFTSFWLEHQLWNLNATGYHIVNVLLHATAAVLLWRVLVALEIPAAWLAACLFAIHPVQAESVAWITERKNVLSAVFYFGAALAYLHWQQRIRPRDYVLALLLFIAALLSKTVTCSLPATLLLILWWKRGRVTQRDVLYLAPFFVIGLALATMTIWFERSHVQAVGPEWNLSIVDRILIAGRAIWFYAGKLILPINLSFIYPRWTIDPRNAVQWAFPIGVIVALIVLWRMRDRWGRGPLVAALIFVGTLVPALGFFNIYPMRYSFVADHFQYHASAALIVLIAIALDRLLRALPSTARYAIVIAPLLLLTFARSAVYRDVEILWRDTLTKNPDSWMVNLNLAKELFARGRRQEAYPYFERQVRLAPHLPETQWNYGSSLLHQRRYNEALAAYDEAIRLGGDPLPQVHFSRGMAYLDLRRPDLAADDFRRAIELRAKRGLDYPAAQKWLDYAIAQQQPGRP